MPSSLLGKSVPIEGGVAVVCAVSRSRARVPKIRGDNGTESKTTQNL